MLILGFVFVYVRIARLTKLFVEFEGSFLSFRLFRYLPAFFFAVIFNFWFSKNLIGEFIFSFILVLFLVSKKLFEESKNVKEEYLLVARNLKLTPSDIYEKIYWKSALPVLSDYFKRIHYYLWVLVLVYEFIGNSHGVGSIYRASLAYNDFTALFTLAIMIALLIWFGDFFIASLKKKLIHWTA
jgi:ABC-type nitrate/sulfonate/bicarbonate transport system permease component